jgi:secreted Zn-dependent insulinase-like peptidase
MIKGNIIDSIVRQNFVPEYSKIVYDIFIKILDSSDIKISTNFNFSNINHNKFIKSKWYNTSFYINNISSDIFNNIINNNLEREKLILHSNKKKIKNKIKKYFIIKRNDTNNNFNMINKDLKLIDWKFDLSNIVGIKNFIIKNNFFQEVDKNNIPEIIDSNKILKRQIFLQEFNKFNKPIANITIIRKNNELLNNENKIIVGIFIELCEKILNYFLEIMGDYKLSFSIMINKEFLIYNFNGLEYKLDYFISQIISKIHPDVIFNNAKTNKYFNEIIRDIKESILNLKYNSPYIICSKYLGYLLDNNMLPEEKIEFILNLTFTKFESTIKKCLMYSKEYIILTNIKKYGHNFNFDFDKNNNYNFYEDNYMRQLINMISLNSNIYLIQNDNNILYHKLNFKDYKINFEFINQNEINNCLIKYWCINSINIKDSNKNNNYDKININVAKNIIKQRIISSIISEILNEPLFDKIRTIDKLGYIVKSDYKTISDDNNIYYIIFFLIQSSYSLEKISNSLIEFNKYFIKDINSNYENYLEKFRLLKDSKLIEFSKPVSDLSEEINIYIEAITSKIFDFNLNKLFYDECKKIDFNKDILPVLKQINITKSKNFNIILEKNKKN